MGLGREFRTRVCSSKQVERESERRKMKKGRKMVGFLPVSMAETWKKINGGRNKSKGRRKTDRRRSHGNEKSRFRFQRVQRVSLYK